MRFIQVSAVAPDVSGQFRRSPTDHQLSALAAAHRDLQTKKHARLALRHNQFSGGMAGVEALIARIAHIRSARLTRPTSRIRERLGHLPSPVTAKSKRKPVLLPIGSLQSRLEAAKKKAVEQAAKSCFRHGAAGGSSVRVTLTDDPASVDYKVLMSSNRTTYGGSFKGWSANEDHHHITVPRDWRIRVLGRGLATAGGMLTLDLQPLLAHGEIELFQAVWVSQSRGFQVKVHRGVIACLGHESFHADDAENAIKGILLKQKRAASPVRVRTDAYSISVDAFVQRYASLGEIEVWAEDAREVGACEYGIKSWCESVDIDLSEVSTDLSRILEGFRSLPLIEVRRTVLHAVRRHRKSLKQAIR